MEKEDFGHAHIWRVAYPLVLGGVAQVVINGTDTAFLGRIGEIAMGAAAIAGLYYVTFFMLGLGFGIGTQILVARHEGENNPNEVRNTMQQSLFFLGALALLLFVLMQVFSPWLLRYFVASDAIRDSCISFITYRSWGIFPGFAILWVRSFYAGTANTRIISVTTLLTALLNMLFNYLLVFGKGGFPAMGISGSGLASTLAETFTACFALLWLASDNKSAKYELLKKMRLDSGAFRKLIELSSPLMLQIFISLCSWFAFFLIIEKTGAHNLAISNLVRNVYMVLMIPLLGFSNATNTLVSNLIGRKESERVFELLKRICLQSSLCTLVIVLFTLTFPRLVMSVFTNDEILISHTLSSLQVISGSCLLFSIVNILLSAISGAGFTIASLIIETLTLIIYLLYVYWLSVRLHLRIEWIWSSEYVYFIMLGCCSLWFLKLRLQRKLALSDERNH